MAYRYLYAIACSSKQALAMLEYPALAAFQERWFVPWPQALANEHVKLPVLYDLASHRVRRA